MIIPDDQTHARWRERKGGELPLQVLKRQIRNIKRWFEMCSATAETVHYCSTHASLPEKTSGNVGLQEATNFATNICSCEQPLQLSPIFVLEASQKQLVTQNDIINARKRCSPRWLRALTLKLPICERRVKSQASNSCLSYGCIKHLMSEEIGLKNSSLTRSGNWYYNYHIIISLELWQWRTVRFGWVRHLLYSYWALSGALPLQGISAFFNYAGANRYHWRPQRFKIAQSLPIVQVKEVWWCTSQAKGC